MMKNVLIISGHPDLAHSLANRTILETLGNNFPEAEVRKLDTLYPDYGFDVKAEQAAWEKADTIVLQFPMNWYALPGILKLYLDKVLEHGWAYGSEGTKLTGKRLIVSVTTGAPGAAYEPDGAAAHKVPEFYYALEQTGALCGMKVEGTVFSTGMLYIPGVIPEAVKDEVVAKAQEQAGKVAALLRA